mmetsp:Transcript_15585/g.51029  ORF Transcript_15585/g.51029 Transcript_15585/m.51029 type:complete len:317 (-) Transcript_15585:334-1284(-)
MRPSPLESARPELGALKVPTLERVGGADAVVKGAPAVLAAHADSRGAADDGLARRCERRLLWAAGQPQQRTRLREGVEEPPREPEVEERRHVALEHLVRPRQTEAVHVRHPQRERGGGRERRRRSRHLVPHGRVDSGDALEAPVVGQRRQRANEDRAGERQAATSTSRPAAAAERGVRLAQKRAQLGDEGVLHRRGPELEQVLPLVAPHVHATVVVREADLRVEREGGEGPWRGAAADPPDRLCQRGAARPVLAKHKRQADCAAAAAVRRREERGVLVRREAALCAQRALLAAASQRGEGEGRDVGGREAWRRGSS